MFNFWRTKESIEKPSAKGTNNVFIDFNELTIVSFERRYNDFYNSVGTTVSYWTKNADRHIDYMYFDTDEDEHQKLIEDYKEWLAIVSV